MRLLVPEIYNTHIITKISFIVPVYNFYVIYTIQVLYVCTYCCLTGYVFTDVFRQSLSSLSSDILSYFFCKSKMNKRKENVALIGKSSFTMWYKIKLLFSNYVESALFSGNWYSHYNIVKNIIKLFYLILFIRGRSFY